MLVFEFFQRFLIFAKPGSVVRRISWLTIIGLGLSLAALILVMSVMTALNQSQKERTLAVEPHLTIEVPELDRVEKILNHPVYFKAKAIESAEVYPFENQDVILRTMDGRFKGAVARGIEWEHLEKTLARIKTHMQIGKKISDVQKPNEGEVVIGVDLAQSLGIFEGDSVMVVPPEGLLLPPSEAPKYEKVRVAQIISTNIPDFDSQVVFYVVGETLLTLRNSASHRIGLELRLSNADDVDSVVQGLSQLSGLKMQTWKERNSALFFALKLEKIMIGLFLSMATLVAGLSLVTVLSLLISQKRKEIALLQTMGYSKKQILQLFSKLGFMLAGIGILFGLCVGTAVAYALELHPLNILPDIYYDSEIPAKVDMLYIAVVFFIASGLAYLGSRWISTNAAEITISSALRGKN